MYGSETNVNLYVDKTAKRPHAAYGGTENHCFLIVPGFHPACRSMTLYSAGTTTPYYSFKHTSMAAMQQRLLLRSLHLSDDIV